MTLYLSHHHLSSKRAHSFQSHYLILWHHPRDSLRTSSYWNHQHLLWHQLLQGFLGAGLCLPLLGDVGTTAAPSGCWLASWSELKKWTTVTFRGHQIITCTITLFVKMNSREPRLSSGRSHQCAACHCYRWLHFCFQMSHKSPWHYQFQRENVKMTF